MELEPLEGLDTSLDESNDEAENGDKGNTSYAGKQKRGKSALEAKLERMVKAILNKNKEYKRDSQEVHLEKLMEGWNGMSKMMNTMMSNNKRKADGIDPLLEEKVLIEETWEVRDDGHKILDWTLRNIFRPINGNLDVYWKEGTWKSELAPVLGSNLTTDHLFPCQ